MDSIPPALQLARYERLKILDGAAVEAALDDLLAQRIEFWVAEVGQSGAKELEERGVAPWS